MLYSICETEKKMQTVYEKILEKIKTYPNLTFVSGTISQHKSYLQHGGAAHNFCLFINKGSLSFSVHLNF